MAQITDKQTRYIERLSGGRWQDAVAADMGCSPSAAYRRATSADGSRTIARLTAGMITSARKEPRPMRTAYGDYL